MRRLALFLAGCLAGALALGIPSATAAAGPALLPQGCSRVAVGTFHNSVETITPVNLCGGMARTSQHGWSCLLTGVDTLPGQLVRNATALCSRRS